MKTPNEWSELAQQSFIACLVFALVAASMAATVALTMWSRHG